MSPIANYTTTVMAMKSIGEIQGMLVAHGATTVFPLQSYAGNAWSQDGEH